MKTSFLFLTFAVFLCGCSRTVVGGGSDSPNNRYEFWISSNGAVGKSYIAKSKKKIRITISSGSGTNRTVFLQKWYDFTGSDLQWKLEWLSDDAVSVVFFDWGDNVNNYENMMKLPASNHIGSLSFVRDPGTGKFSEKK